MYINYKFKYNTAKRENTQFDSYYNQELNGAELATIINKAIDNNLTNNVPRDNKGKFINNNNNSINIDIKMLDVEETYNMEKLYSGGMEKFVQYYGQIQFKCTSIEYHKSTNKIKQMLFEQITQ